MNKLMIAAAALGICMGVTAFAKDTDDKAMGPEKKMAGYVTDSKCAHTNMAHDEACAKKCVDGGDKAVFVTDKGGKVWDIQNQDAVKDHLGHHVSIDGHVNAKENSVHIVSVEMLKTQGTKAAGSGEMHDMK